MADTVDIASKRVYIGKQLNKCREQARHFSQRKTMELQDYITTAEGITPEIRQALEQALVSDPNGHELERVINETAAVHLTDETRNFLNILHAVQFDSNY